MTSPSGPTEQAAGTTTGNAPVAGGAGNAESVVRWPEAVVLRMARPYLGRLIGAGLLATGTELAGLTLMATATWLLITAADMPPLPVLTVAIVSVRALAIGRGVLRYTERLAGHDAVLRLLTDVRARVFGALAARRSPEPGSHSGDALSRLVSDVEAVQDLLIRVVVPAAAAVGVAVLALVTTAFIAPVAALPLAVGLLIAGLVLPVVAVALTRRTADRMAPIRGELAADVIDLTHGAADLAAYGATGEALAAAADRANELARLERRLALTGWAVDGAGVLVSGLTAAAVLTAALRSDASGAEVGVLAVGTLAAVEATLALVAAARQWAHLRGGLTRVAELLAAPSLSDGPASTEATTGTRPESALELHDVVVRYRAGDPPALDGVDLELTPGVRIAVVGPSGAGKSTLLAVLIGAVTPESGTATLNGVPISAYPEAALPHQVGGLLAEAHVFHAGVRENLLLGRDAADPEEQDAAMRAADLLDWVGEQPDGWDTLVGEDGAKLSGGQRQRLALARALLAAPRHLLLDEPTEGLDPQAADRVLRQALDVLPPETAVLLVTHRLRGLAGFDEVLVLDRGRVIQRGRHEDLITSPGWYAETWLAQEAAERGYLAVAP
ncbi:thiol reductant ABC exporter subunit CydC [Catenuloplanes sp. NPDC051500]|uniref:thiol reductant ABC exporter subunit CydC n=1 Tax=Catenuloplanes sp. NPDC051500 TaxID=3363959 RepID=UPI003794D67A